MMVQVARYLGSRLGTTEHQFHAHSIISFVRTQKHCSIVGHCQLRVTSSPLHVPQMQLQGPSLFAPLKAILKHDRHQISCIEHKAHPSFGALGSFVISTFLQD
ncbi:hypothetical protein GOBAR_AA37730 [Gossypium barbadense]|uniref:Uncharacterized protein n=1 Tax=Gossypium barbadense TaxID=3634 RepID=A0A2P5VVW3_GOSBA|nr:hypothetical protein GOBAR_AA37730 [Gossypium barbadense]